MRSNNQSGFTLLEMIIVTVITGILAGIVAMFLTAPVQQYMDVARRAELTDIADTAFQRVLRDIRTAVPYSVRLPGGAPSASYIEFLPAKAGGRYRLNDIGGSLCGGATVANAGDALAFGTVDNCFEVIGPPITFAPNDQIVVGSAEPDGSYPYLDFNIAPASAVRRTIDPAGVGINMPTVKFISTVALTALAQLPGQRFQVVDGLTQAVTYSCEGVGTDPASGNGTGQLKRYSGYGFNSPQSLPGTIPAILANNISACSFAYAPGITQRDNLVALTLQITQSNETVSLYEEVHVNNAP